MSSFSSISSISSSPSNNFNLTTISKFQPQIFSNPRTTDFFQIRRYSVETQSLIAQGKKKQKKSPDPIKKKLAEYNRKVDEAFEALEKVEYSKRSYLFWPDYKRDAELANKAINRALKKYDEVLSILGEDERKDFEDDNWWGKKRMLDIQEQTMNDELMNFEEVLKIWRATFEEEDQEGSGGTGC
ncbi:hypothetical protein MKX03_010351 [Papaver bracteatum]|nr:hypothetical protein MKX03_010351 [Papaver bracteatum]